MYRTSTNPNDIGTTGGVAIGSQTSDERFKNIENIGISAGASTPDEIIEEVVARIKQIGKITEKEIIYE